MALFYIKISQEKGGLQQRETILASAKSLSHAIKVLTDNGIEGESVKAFSKKSGLFASFSSGEPDFFVGVNNYFNCHSCGEKWAEDAYDEVAIHCPKCNNLELPEKQTRLIKMKSEGSNLLTYVAVNMRKNNY